MSVLFTVAAALSLSRPSLCLPPVIYAVPGVEANVYYRNVSGRGVEMSAVSRVDMAAAPADKSRPLTLALLGDSMAKKDTRPYEFIDANRVEDEIPPWIGFETETGWKAQATDGAAAAVCRSNDRMIFGDWTLLLNYRGSGDVRVKPASPLPLPENHEWFGVWMWNDQTNYGIKKRLSPEYGLVFIGPDGREFRMRMRRNGYDKVLYWQEWHYLTKRFSRDERLLLDRPGVRFDGFYISGDAGDDSRELHFDNLAFFNRDETKPLTMKKVPDAGIPTRAEGALPDSNSRGGTNEVRAGDTETVFSYAGPDGRLVYFWKGCPDTLEASWNGGARFRPARWSGARQNPAAAEYSVKIAGKTLVVDVKASAGEEFVSMGRPDGIKVLSRSNVASLQDGYDWENSRSQVSALDDGNSKFFTMTFNDWYVSGASRMGFSPDTAAVTNRAAQYLPKTDGRRNPVFERLYITVSPELMETLPVIANPVSPWKSEVGSRAWCAYGSSANRDFDKQFWKKLYDLGVRKVTINDHECCMRDDGESFTFREKAAPKKGGDRAWRDYADYLIGELGFRYGPYNNFTDFAPVNANWRFDRVCRETAEPYYAYGEIKDCHGGMKSAWMRNYAPKPQYAYEACAYYAPRLKKKFGFNTAYCDVHTAVFPWEYVDYDWRCEGAGTFHTVYGAYAAIMLEQKQAWNGPVYSEGGCHFMYAGLTDGNYAQVRIDADKDPWIVDFGLKRIHPLEIDFGMGNPDMFLNPKGDHAAPEFAAIYDRFFAATLAFGHAPYLLIEAMFSKRASHALGYPRPDVNYAPEKGLAYLLRSYYMVRPASARYALASAEKILYLGDDGVWRGVSAAILSGDRKMNRIAVRYSDGTHVVANGDTVKRLAASVFGRDLDLPPTGYAAWSDDGTLEIESSDRFGTRVDYSASPDAVYLDTRDCPNEVVFPKARGKGRAVTFRDGSRWKTVPLSGEIVFDATTLSAASAALRPPAVPLVSVDPHFSLWSAADRLYEADTTFWTGVRQPLSILLEADGVTYRLCGRGTGCQFELPVLEQTDLKVGATVTAYRFGKATGLSAEVEFITPRLTEDLDVFSRPVTYVVIKVHGAAKHRVTASISAAFATNDDHAKMAWTTNVVEGLAAVSVGRVEQTPFSAKGDGRRPDWGYAHLVGPSVKGDETHFLLAYDNLKSVRFFGDELVDWWRRDGKAFPAMLAEAERDYPSLADTCRRFDAGFSADMESVGGGKYAAIAALAWRQSFGACKLVAGIGGEPFMFSCENASGGMIGTTDVFYPQLPHLLMTSLALAKATLSPTCIYAASTNWPYAYAPHDLGLFPVAEGQYYGMKKGQSVGGGDDDTYRMPVEECGNMLLSLGAVAKAEGNADFAGRWWGELGKWAEYLARFGYDPGNQLCTDDFAGHLAHNSNLSIKSIMALGAYAMMADMRGEKAVAAKNRALAESMVPKWLQSAKGGAHGAYRIAFDRPDSWSLKYNLVWDRLLGLRLFPESIAAAEMRAYRAEEQAFGVPLDCRKTYTKADWLVWCGTLTGRRDDLEFMVDGLYRYLDKTPDRIPFNDWYMSDSGLYRGFIARSVVGGVFIPVLGYPELIRKNRR